MARGGVVEFAEGVDRTNSDPPGVFSLTPRIRLTFRYTWTTRLDVADKWISSGSRTVVCETYEALRTMVKHVGDCFLYLGRIIKRIVKEI